MKGNIGLIALAVLAAPCIAGEVDYQRSVRPLLIEKCSACHGAIKQEAGLRLDAGKLIHQGSENGNVIDVQSPGESQLLARVTNDDLDLRMPPEGEGEPLRPAQVELLRRWIAAGANYPEDEAIPGGPDSHWAYQIPVKVDVPRVDDAAWSHNPIDAFVFAKLKQRGLRPAPPADRETQLRRVYLDLIGLPPTPSQQQAFVANDRDDAWPGVVDELLASQAYGERWARHWMDVWRYSDWDGYKQELRGSQRHIWRWRDWIIESLNDDKPYDRMVVEMLAGDELAPADRATLRATGYLARNFHKSNRNIWLDATVEHTAKAFLGMTINCARCHDHKYDPIRQREYYALRAIFEPHNVRTERVPGERDIGKNGFVRAFDAKPNEPTYLYIGGNEKSPDKQRPVPPAVPSVIDVPFQIQPIDLPPVAVFPALRAFHREESLAAALQKLQAAKTALDKLSSAQSNAPARSLEKLIAQQRVELAQSTLASVEARWKAEEAKYGGTADDEAIKRFAADAAMGERAVAVAAATLTLRTAQLALAKAEAAQEQEAKKKQAAVGKAKKELADAEKKLAVAEETLKKPNQTNYTSFGKSYPMQSTGRRLALARWMSDRRNPLTARVAVNHIWLRHFGEPLVDNVFDLGMRSPEPVHRTLLDWLAVEFMEHDWSMKHLHRLIVTSRLYRSASHVHPNAFAANQQQDPDNRLLWKSNVRRLDAEVIRDSILHIAGSLDHKLGGPDIDQSQGATVARRSLYFRHAYEKQMLMMTTFDAAAPSECYRRSESVIPQQALALANGPLAIEQSRILAGKLSGNSDSADAFIRAAFRAVLCRDCSQDELSACGEFLTSQAEIFSQSSKLQVFQTRSKVRRPPASDPAERARENLVHVLLNHNDFVTVR